MKLFRNKRRLTSIVSTTAAIAAVMTLGWAVAAHTNLLNGVFDHGTAYANPQADSCIHITDGINVNNANANATVKVTNDCSGTNTRKLVMKAYYAPSANGEPHEGQVQAGIGDPVTMYPGKEPTKINVATPNNDATCFYQFDVVDITNAPGADGYPIVKAATGGTHDCRPTPQPVYACTGLTDMPGATDAASGNQNFAFQATGTAQNATIIRYDFNFGDGTTTGFPSGNPAATTTHVYAPGEYTASVVITVRDEAFQVHTTAATDCQVHISVPPVQTPPPPVKTLTCDYLHDTPGAIDTNGNQAYSFSAKGTATNTTITGYNFVFGDGNETTSDSANIAHTYAPGEYDAQVSLLSADAPVTSAACIIHVSVKPPVAQPVLTCDSLKATAGTINKTSGEQAYSFAAKATAQHTTITSYSFDYGDTKNQTVNTSATTASAKHSYAPGDYTARVTVNSATDHQSSDNCAVPVHVKPLECKPGVPAGSSDCSTLTCVALSYTPGTLHGDGSQDFSFIGSASKDDATITSYVFHFGDGSADQTVNSSATSANTSHTFAASTAGYDTTVTVLGRDAAGQDIQNTNADCQKHITPAVQTPGVAITKLVNGQKSIITGVNTQFTYALKVTNNGQQDLTNVVVTDTPDAGVTLVSADRGAISANSWTFTIPSLKVGESQSFNLVGTVPTYLAGSINNTACVNAPEVNPGKPDQMDSCDTATVTVTPPPTTPPTTPSTPSTPQVLGVTMLVNTGPGSVIGLFAIAAIAGTIAHRMFLRRKLSS